MGMTQRWPAHDAALSWNDAALPGNDAMRFAWGRDVVPPRCCGATRIVKCHLMETYRLHVKEKGRTVLPVGLQRACGFSPGAELVARPIGDGRFVVESTDAILERIWSRVPSGADAGTETPADAEHGDAVESLHAWRADTTDARRSALQAPELASADESDRRAARLLAELGL